MDEVKVEIKNMKTNESKVLNGVKILGNFIYIDDGEGIYVILSDLGYYFMNLVYYAKGVKKVCWGHRWSLEDNVFECDYNNLLSVCFHYGMDIFIDNFHEEDWIIPPYTKGYEPIEIQIKIETTSVSKREDGIFKRGYWDEQKKKYLEKIIEYGYSIEDLEETIFSAARLENSLINFDGPNKILAIKGKVTY